MRKTYYKHKIENLLLINKIVTIHDFKFSKNFKSQGESHDFWEMVYAYKNSLLCTADGINITLKEGEILFHKPNEFHSLSSNGISAPQVFIISFECKSEAMRFFEGKKLLLKDEFTHYVNLIKKECSKTFDLSLSSPELKKLPLLNKPILGGQQIIKNVLEILLINIMRAETESNDGNDAFLPSDELNERIANDIIQYLKKNLENDVSIKQIANTLNYNKSYLFKKFKQATGKGIIEYFTELKIARAKKLLESTGLSVKEIAERLCFDTPNYFCKVFKKFNNLTPLEYKKLKKERNHITKNI